MDALDHARLKAMENALEYSELKKTFKAVIKDGKVVLKQKTKRDTKPINNSSFCRCPAKNISEMGCSK